MTLLDKIANVPDNLDAGTMRAREWSKTRSLLCSKPQPRPVRGWELDSQRHPRLQAMVIARVLRCLLADQVEVIRTLESEPMSLVYDVLIMDKIVADFAFTITDMSYGWMTCDVCLRAVQYQRKQDWRWVDVALDIPHIRAPVPSFWVIMCRHCVRYELTQATKVWDSEEADDH